MDVSPLVENIHHTGAIVTPPHPDVKGIGASSTPFDWSIGFNISQPLVVKNQGKSYSCGGMATAYREEVLDGEPKSARSIYSKCFVPGGGSGEQGLWNVVSSIGVARESDLPSYQSGMPPDEWFMEVSDWNVPLEKEAGQVRYINLDIDSLAEAIRDNSGIIIGLYGMNNGTWLSADPQPPTSNDWAHWVFCVGAGMRNGEKSIKIINSWGSGVGEGGYQWLSENYIPHLWSAWTFVDVSKYIFKTDLKFMNIQNDRVAVKELQKRLGVPFPTGFFGWLTLSAVKDFQRSNGLPVTGFVGPLTRGLLNR